MVEKERGAEEEQKSGWHGEAYDPEVVVRICCQRLVRARAYFAAGWRGARVGRAASWWEWALLQTSSLSPLCSSLLDARCSLPATHQKPRTTHNNQLADLGKI